jgi:hypothetical protein
MGRNHKSIAVSALPIKARGVHHVDRFAPKVTAAVTASTDSIVFGQCAACRDAVRPGRVKGKTHSGGHGHWR